MAVLPDNDRATLHAELMQLASEMNVPLPVLKAALRNAVDATDQWIEDNAASYNQALPSAVRSALSASQKARLLAIVAKRKYEVA